MEILRVENLSKVYGEGSTKVVAIDDISLTIEKGEFVAIVGASGSGKSTLLHMLGGVDRPSSGKVYLNGQNIFELAEDKLALFRRRHIGLIYQFFNLLPMLTVEENIMLPLLLDNRGVNYERLNELINVLGLENIRGHLPSELSGGQQQRTSIARAMIINPLIILADEPTGNLDTKSSDEVVALFRKFNKKFSQTVVMITHDMEIAKSADKIIHVVDGKITGKI